MCPSYEPLGTEIIDIIILYLPCEACAFPKLHKQVKCPSCRSVSLHPFVTSTHQDLKQNERGGVDLKKELWVNHA